MSKEEKAKEEKCCAGCKRYSGEETRHIKECMFYPESFSKMYDDLDKKHEDAQFVIGEYERQIEDLSTQLAAYKEALSMIVELTNDMENAKTDFEYNIRSAERKVLIAKAKTLIE